MQDIISIHKIIVYLRSSCGMKKDAPENRCVGISLLRFRNAGGQPFVAPLVRPATNSFWRTKKRMAGGMMASSVPARKMP